MNLKERLGKGDFCVGPFIKAGSPALIEVMGYAGLDFVLLDMEHGPFSFEALEHQIMAAELAGIFPVVRVQEVSEPAILRPLDKGVGGILVPHVHTREMAEEVIRYASYAPRGERGMDVYSRAAKYGHTPKNEYLRRANDDILIAIQIEGKEGVDNLDGILTTEGVDVIFIGPYDLSQSLGIPGEVNHPLLIEEVERIAGQVRETDRSVGIYADDIETARKWIGLGIQSIALSVDTAIYYQACKGIVRALRE